jgi:peroxiredoxin Q/BCP
MFSWLFSDPLPPGTPAPDFSLPDSSGENVTLSKLRGKRVVLIFYPGDDTPGCTNQLCQMRDDWSRLKNVRIFGVNPQAAGSHEHFREKYHLPFPLLIDKGQKVAAMYQANGIIVKRTVYGIDPDGTIVFSRRGSPRLDQIFPAK